MKKIVFDIKAHKLAYSAILLFVIFSALIRFVPIIRGDTPFLFDHGRDMLAVKQIVVGHKLTLIGPFTGMQGIFQSPLHFYLLTIPFILTEGNPTGGTWIIAILALVGIFLCFSLWRETIDIPFAVTLALFFAFAPTSIAFSSHFWNPHWIPFCMILFYYFLYKSVFVNKRFWPWAGLLAGFIAQFEVAFGAPLFISIFFLALFFRRNAFRSLSFWIIIPVFFATFLPQMLFDIRHQFLMTKTIISFLHGANNGTGGIIPFPTRFFYRLNEIQLATIFTLSGNTIVDYVLFLPILFFPIAAFFLHWKKEVKPFLFFLFVPVFFFVLFLFYSHEAWSWYWIGLQVSYYMLLSFVLSCFLVKGRNWKIVYYIAIALFILVIVVPELYGLRYPFKGDTGTMRNELGVIDYIYHDTQGKPFGEFVYTPPIYDYAYQYLFWWKSRQYGYAATNDKRGIFYLIIEPDKDHPYAINGWKQTVIKTGKILWDKILPGNITVEKRIGKS